MDKLEDMEKRLQYLEGKEAEREAEKQRWINGSKVTMADGNVAEKSITTARLSESLL